MNKMRSRAVAWLRGAWRLLRYPVLVVAGLVITALLFDESGVEGMTFVDWLDLLIIPVVLAGAAYLFNRRENTIQREIAEKERDVDREIARDKRNEDIVQNYLDKMTDLMRDEDWLVREMKGIAGEEEDEQPALSPKADRLFDIARVRTVSTLRALEGDTKRQASTIHFLREAELLTGEKNPAVLARAIMQNLDLQTADLRNANLQTAVLWEANLQTAVLTEANLQTASLRNANLQGAFLSNANLQEAVLRAANLQEAVLTEVEFDKETTLPDTTKWSEDVDMRKFTDATHPEFWEPK